MPQDEELDVLGGGRAAYQQDHSCFALFWRCRWSVGRGDTPVTRGSWILRCEEDSIDRSFTVLVRVICRCVPVGFQNSVRVVDQR